MRNTLIAFVAVLGISGNVLAGENQASENAELKFDRYVATISEYQLEKPVSETATEAEIIELIRQQKVVPSETVRLSTINRVESLVQFGKSVTVTTGKVVQGTRTMRHTNQVEIGTLLQVVVESEGDVVSVKVAFESSRLQGEGTDDSPPDIVKSRIESTQVLELGKSCLLGSTSGGETSYILLTIMRAM